MGNIRTLDFKDQYGYRPETTFDLSYERQADGEGEGKRIIEGIATKSGMDLNDVVVTKKALKKAERDLIKMSTILENHDFKRPVGRVTDSIFHDNSGELRIKGFISETEDVVWRKIQEGVLHSFSIQWRSLDIETEFDEDLDRVIAIVHEMSIFESSVVSVAGMPGSDITSAVQRSLSDGTLQFDRGVPYTEPFVPPFIKVRAAPRGRKWDASAAVRRMRRLAGGPDKETIDWERYSRGFAYVVPEGTNFGDYKFPLRDVINGRLTSVFRAATRAAGRLANFEAPSEDKSKIANRIKRELMEIHDVQEDDLPDTIKEIST